MDHHKKVYNCDRKSLFKLGKKVIDAHIGVLHSPELDIVEVLVECLAFICLNRNDLNKFIGVFNFIFIWFRWFGVVILGLIEVREPSHNTVYVEVVIRFFKLHLLFATESLVVLNIWALKYSFDEVGPLLQISKIFTDFFLLLALFDQFVWDLHY